MMDGSATPLQLGKSAAPGFKSLEVQGFRGFSDFRVDHLSKVNLITGKNNSGKSSLLEAIRILATGGALGTFRDILAYREESGNLDGMEEDLGARDFVPFCNFFNGFPDLVACGKGFSISAKGNGRVPASIEIRIVGLRRKIDPERPGSAHYEQVDIFDDVAETLGLDMSVGDRKRIVPLDRLSRRFIPRIEADVSLVPCIYLDPFGSRSTGGLSALWDKISLTDDEQEVLAALQIISDDIQAVSMVAGDERGNRTAIVRSNRYSKPMPLKTFGDGVNRLFGIILSLCCARKGVLLVDEIENGLHHSIQSAVWRTIFRLSNRLDIQVFATTHSWDCVCAFQEAIREEGSENGALIRLTKQEERIVPTLFSASELEIATRNQIEVR
jgi:predicted ATPase